MTPTDYLCGKTSRGTQHWRATPGSVSSLCIVNQSPELQIPALPRMPFNGQRQALVQAGKILL